MDQEHKRGCDVVVVAYRQPDMLLRFAHTLIDWPPTIPIAVHVVDVDPDPDDVAAAQQTADDLAVIATDVTYTRHLENIGYNRAVNLAGADGDRDVVIACNADVAWLTHSEAVRLDPQHGKTHAIDTLYRGLTFHPDWGAVGPRQIDQQRTITAGGIIGTHRHPRHRHWRRHVNASPPVVLEDAVTVAGSILALRRDTWDLLTACDVAPGDNDVGPFLPNAHYWGDTWLCYHAAAHGLKSVYDGTATAYHDVHGADPRRSHGRANQHTDQAAFRAACDAHGLEHD